MLKATATGVFSIVLIVSPVHKINIPPATVIDVKGLQNGYEIIVEKQQKNIEYFIIAAK